MNEEKEISEQVGLTEEQEKQLKEALKEQFEKIRNQSLIQGARMVASIVVGYARQKKEPYNKRINNIIRFCDSVLNNTSRRAEEIGMKLENDETKDE